MDKKQYILEAMIREYIKSKEPIGSEFLQRNMDIDVSSATIRNYFKKILDDGNIYQEHISSGRKPTISALKKYWIEKLDFIHHIYISDIDKLKEKVQSFGVFCSIRFTNKNSLLYTQNLSNCFLLVVFSENQFVISYDKNIEDFLNSFIGVNSYELSKISKKVNILKLEDEIAFMDRKNYLSFNKIGLLEKLINSQMNEDKIFDMLSFESFNRTKNGIYFDSDMPENMMILKANALICSQESEIMYIGEVDKNFEEFFSI